LFNPQGRNPLLEKECIICNSKGENFYAGLGDMFFNVPGEWSLLKCSKCGLFWINPKPNMEEVQEFYIDYFTHQKASNDGQINHIIRKYIPMALLGYEAFSSDVSKVKFARLFSYFGPIRETGLRSVLWLHAKWRGRLLDVGCGSGDFLKCMQELGWDVMGVEADRVAAENAKLAVGSQKIYTGQFEDISFPKNGFDVITMVHVVEHVIDPAGTIQKCFSLLKPGGLLIIVTPNANSLGRRFFGRFWVGWDIPRHIHIFNTQNLSQLAVDTGFQINSAFSSAGATNYFWSLSQYVREKSNDRQHEVNISAFPMKLKREFFWLLEYFLNYIGRESGEEAVLMAEKPKD